LMLKESTIPAWVRVAWMHSMALGLLALLP